MFEDFVNRAFDSITLEAVELVPDFAVIESCFFVEQTTFLLFGYKVLKQVE